MKYNEHDFFHIVGAVLWITCKQIIYREMDNNPQFFTWMKYIVLFYHSYSGVCISYLRFIMPREIWELYFNRKRNLEYKPHICCQWIDHIDPLWDIGVCTSCFTFVVNESIILTHYGIQGYVHHVLHLLSINRSYWPIMGHKGMYIMFYICCQWIDHIDPLWDIRVCTSCFTFVVNQSIILTHYGT